MEKSEEENGVENNPNNTKGDGDTLDSGGNGSDETGVTDPAVQAKENSTVVVSNGKTDDNQNKKDTSQEVPEEIDPAQYATGHDTIPPKVLVKTDTSKSKQEPDPGSSAKEKQNIERGERDVPDSVQASVPSLYDKTSASDTSEHSQNLGLQVTEHDNGASQLEGDEGPEEAVVTQLLATLYYTTSPEGQGTTPDLQEASRTMSSENGSTALPTTDSPEVKKSNDESPAATDTSIITSEKTGNTNASRSEVNELMKEPQATAHDNGASKLEGDEEFHDAVDTTCGKTDVSSKIIKPNNPGDNRTLASENKQSGSQNLQSESGSSHAGHAGGKGAEETEAQMRDANGRSEEEMKTGSGANKDDDKEGQPKKKKAKGEGGTTHAVKTKQRVIKERRVSISLCTSAYSFNVEGLVSYLNGLMKKHPKLIKEVKIHELPYNDLDNYRFDDKDPVDVMILCHSINNRGFSITDVMCALYDEYLPYCARVVGKEKMGVIVHDFDDMRETVQSSRMSSFKYKQPKAFETTSLQITCGHIEKEEQVRKQMLRTDREKIVGFLEHASKYPEEMQKEESKWSLKRFFSDFKMPSFGFGSSGKVNEGQIEESAARRNMCSNISTAELEQKNHDWSNEGTAVDPRPEITVGGDSKPDPPRGTSPVGAVHATAASGIQHAQGAMDLPSQQNMTQNSEKDFTSALQSSSRTPRRISVSVCSSAYQNNVKGLLSWFANFQFEYPHMIADVRFRSLPYDIDSFKFPQKDPVDVMVLCHSIQNRGFSITNVMSALYEKYLKYCHDVIGKTKLAVIVHDFTDLKPATAESRMESFRRSQPLTFKLVDTVIICGSLEDQAKLDMTEEDKARLIIFLERARMAPRENSTMSTNRSFVGSLFGFGKS